MGFSRQDYWSGLPFPSPGDLPDPGIKPASLVSPALAGGFFTPAPLGRPRCMKQKLLRLGFPELCKILSETLVPLLF